MATRGDTETFWGGLAILFGAAGSIVSHPASAQAFSAAGATSSGVNAVIDQAYFANLAVEIITAGLSKRRKDILEEIDNKRERAEPRYAVNEAIADALRYHSACSAVTGLEVAQSSITRVDNPEPGEFLKFLRTLTGLKPGTGTPPQQGEEESGGTNGSGDGSSANGSDEGDTDSGSDDSPTDGTDREGGLVDSAGFVIRLNSSGSLGGLEIVDDSD
ncbi:MAG: hypothetical protein AAFY69_13635 [Pseudomonadota bacterium]